MADRHDTDRRVVAELVADPVDADPVGPQTRESAPQCVAGCGIAFEDTKRVEWPILTLDQRPMSTAIVSRT